MNLNFFLLLLLVFSQFEVFANSNSNSSFESIVENKTSNINVTSIVLNPNKAAIFLNNTIQLTATVLPSNAINKTVIWASSNSGCATVNSAGLVTGKALGEVTISATTEDGAKIATCAITIYTLNGTRDALKQPFSSTSIWNTPIGSNAVYVPAGILPPSKAGMTVDEDIIILSPSSPLTDIRMCTAGWNQTKSRCTAEAGSVFPTKVPIPFDFVVNLPMDQVPNSCATILMADGVTIRQTQPFARCVAGEPATSQYSYISDMSINGDGRVGIHGGSGLSALGGTIRAGELKPGAGPIKHVLKLNVYAGMNLYYDITTKGFRWPASWADAYASTTYGKTRPSNASVVKACRMGALVALKPTLDINDPTFLKTEPARMIAQALQDYGAYIADDTYWNVIAIETEWGPNGRVVDNFCWDWGFPMVDSRLDSDWSSDMNKIFTNLHIIDNNSASTIGGGGIPRVPLALPLQ